MTRAALPLLGFTILLLAACKKDGAVPAYAIISPVMVQDAGGQEISSKITDLWVYLNDQPVGVWQPGRAVPLIGEGEANLKVIAGVRRNGITDDRIQYPFYATWQQQIQLRPGQRTTVQANFRYFDGLDQWLDDFNTGQRFDTINSSATMALVPGDGSLPGMGSQFGRISLDAEHPLYRGVSSGDPFITGAKAFLELDYRSDTRLLIGVRYMRNGYQNEVAYVYAKPTKLADGTMPWNKLYVDLGEPWNVGGASDKRFFIKAALEDGATTATVDLDNVKLVRPAP